MKFEVLFNIALSGIRWMTLPAKGRVKSTYRNFPSIVQEQGFDTFYSRGDGTWP